MSVFFVFGVKVSAETISVVSDTAYAPLNSKILIRPTRVSTLISSTKLPNVKIGTLTKPSLVSMQLSMLFNQAKLTPLWPVLLLPTHVRRSLLSQTLYYDTSIVIYTRSSDKVSDYKQLKGKTVGVKNGTAAQTWLDKNASKYGFTVKTFDTSDLMNNSWIQVQLTQLWTTHQLLNTLLVKEKTTLSTLSLNLSVASLSLLKKVETRKSYQRLQRSS